jgi:hypothetical protein
MPIYEIHNPGHRAVVLEADSFTTHTGSVTFRGGRDNTTQVAVVYVMPGTVVVEQTATRSTKKE